MTTRVIDADGHVQENSPEILEYLPDVYREMALETPRSVGLVPPVVGLFPPLDHLHTSFRHSVASFNREGRVRAPEWQGFLDDVGIERSVLYPTAGLSVGRINYPEVAVALARAYNDWLAASYTSVDARLGGMALLPLQVPDAAVTELRRAVTEDGFLGAMLPSNGLKGHLGSPEYWPIFEEAERLGCCIAVHGGSHIGWGLDHLDVWPLIHALGHPWGQMIALAGIMGNGVFDRFPGLRIAFLEGGVNWFVTCLERFDNSWAAFSQHDPNGRFPAIDDSRASDYLLGQIDAGRIFIGCEGDELGLGRFVELVGSKPLVFSSDFPHEVTSETCRHEIDELLENPALSGADKQAILADNAERLYRFPSTLGNT
jgi:predicted TIM-barrel fold metal-dependent hydrolase